MSQGAAAAAAGGGRKLAHHVSWLWRGPRRALCAARDLYVRTLTGCASHLPADAAFFGYPTFAAHGFASSSRRSSSADAADEDGPSDFASAAAAAAVLFPRSRSYAPAGSGRVAGRRGRVAA